MKHIRSNCLATLTLFVFSVTLFAQHGNAPTGYYPSSYGGSTFRGKIVSSNKETSTITLEYKDKKKTEVFTAGWEAPCHRPIDRKDTTFLLSDVPLGAEIILFYSEFEYKENNQKKTRNVVVAISPVAENGIAIPEDKRLIMYCAKNPIMRFMAY